MATRYIGMTVSDGPQLVGGDVIGAASGGTLAGSQVVQVVFDDDVYTSAQEGKQQLLSALAIIVKRIETAKNWPVTTGT